MQILSKMWLCLFRATLVIYLASKNRAEPSTKTTACGVHSTLRQPRINLEIINWKNSSDNVSRSGKIMYGTATKAGQFPWQASLELLHPTLGFIGHWCGGVLIHKDWILSAAHCVKNDLFTLSVPILWTAVLGEYNREEESGVEQRITLDKIILHDNYTQFKNDIALMKLAKSAILTANSQVATICLPNAPQIQEKEERTSRDMKYVVLNTRSRFKPLTARSYMNEKIKMLETIKYERKNKLKSTVLSEQFTNNVTSISYTDCVTTGWGIHQPDGFLTDVLHQTKVVIHMNRKCEELYEDYVAIQRSHLCAGNENEDECAALGDSGGPLQCRVSSSGPWILVGITSFGAGCLSPGYPDVYTKVENYVKWILKLIKIN